MNKIRIKFLSISASVLIFSGGVLVSVDPFIPGFGADQAFAGNGNGKGNGGGNSNASGNGRGNGGGNSNAGGNSASASSGGNGNGGGNSGSSSAGGNSGGSSASGNGNSGFGGSSFAGGGSKSVASGGNGGKKGVSGGGSTNGRGGGLLSRLFGLNKPSESPAATTQDQPKTTNRGRAKNQAPVRAAKSKPAKKTAPVNTAAKAPPKPKARAAAVKAEKITPLPRAAVRRYAIAENIEMRFLAPLLKSGNNLNGKSWEQHLDSTTGLKGLTVEYIRQSNQAIAAEAAATAALDNFVGVVGGDPENLPTDQAYADAGEIIALAESAAAADQALSDALAAAGYATRAEYEAAVLAGALPVQPVDDAIAVVDAPTIAANTLADELALAGYATVEDYQAAVAFDATAGVPALDAAIAGAEANPLPPTEAETAAANQTVLEYDAWYGPGGVQELQTTATAEAGEAESAFMAASVSYSGDYTPEMAAVRTHVDAIIMMEGLHTMVADYDAEQAAAAEPVAGAAAVPEGSVQLRDGEGSVVSIQ